MLSVWVANKYATVKAAGRPPGPLTLKARTTAANARVGPARLGGHRRALLRPRHRLHLQQRAASATIPARPPDHRYRRSFRPAHPAKAAGSAPSPFRECLHLRDDRSRALPDCRSFPGRRRLGAQPRHWFAWPARRGWICGPGCQIAGVRASPPDPSGRRMRSPASFRAPRLMRPAPPLLPAPPRPGQRPVRPFPRPPAPALHCAYVATSGPIRGPRIAPAPSNRPGNPRPPRAVRVAEGTSGAAAP